MVLGLLTHNFIGVLAPAAPILIFMMLLITFCKINPSEIRITPLTGWLAAIQLTLSFAVYAVTLPFNPLLAQGLFICVFCPTATAAPVITGMLGGSIPNVAVYSIIINAAVALLSPVLFPLINNGEASPDLCTSVFAVAKKIVPLVFLPLVTAFVLRAKAPRLHHAIATHQSLSFYMWAVSLTLVVGTSVSFVMKEPPALIPLMVLLALGAGVVCVLQFAIGRLTGKHYGDKISAAQSLGQKNTVLAIWMALSWLNPVTSVAPAAYIAWQNSINSLQLYLHQKRLNS